MARKKKRKAADTSDDRCAPQYHTTLNQWRLMIIADAHTRAMKRQAERAAAQEGLPDEQRTA